jgi:Tol biopolymer transport system component
MPTPTEPGYVGVASIDGTGLKQLYTLARGSAREPIWTPDGRGILIAEPHGNGTSSIVRIPVDGAPPVIVAANIPRLQSFDLSPDGHRLAFSTDDRTTDVWTLDLSSVLRGAM